MGAASPAELLKLTRPANCVIAFASVAVGAGMGGVPPHTGRTFLACLSAALIAAGGNAFNDACDEASDRFNQPHRPVASGSISAATARRIAWVLFGIGGGLSLSLGPQAVGVALLAIAGLWAYNVHLKRVPLIGNGTVSVICGLSLIYGGLAAGRIGAAVVPAGFAFLIHFGREVLKDVEDMEGDAAVGSGSLALARGVRAALKLAVTTFTFLIAVTPLPFLWGPYQWPYLVLVLFPVDVVLVHVILSIRRDPSRANLTRMDQLLKANMVFGLVALWAGRG